MSISVAPMLLVWNFLVTDVNVDVLLNDPDSGGTGATRIMSVVRTLAPALYEFSIVVLIPLVV